MFTIQPISAVQVTVMTDKLKAGGTTVTPTGDGRLTVAGHGVTAVAMFDETAQLLTVDIRKKPFYAAESMIESGIRDALKGV